MRTKWTNTSYLGVIAYLMFVLVGISDEVTPSNNLRASEDRVKSAPTAARRAAAERRAVAVPRRRSLDDASRQNPADAKQHEIIDVQIKGDLEFFDSFNPVEKDGKSLRQELFYDLAGKSLSMNDVRDICMQYTQVMVDRGYYLAYVKPVTNSVSSGTVSLEVKTATYGNNRLFHKYQKDPSGKPAPYQGTHYTANQIKMRLDNPLADPFNYKTLQNQIFSLNSNPDLTLDTTLHVVSNEEQTRQRVDVDYLVTERTPFHGSFQIDNTATEQTDEWRGRLTVQHLNLTKRFDILTTDLTTSFDGNVVSGASSYSRPLDTVRRGSLTLFAGASNLDIDSVLPGIDTDGEGWFAGFQFRKGLCDCDESQFDLILDLTHRNTEDQLLNTAGVVQERQVGATPVSVGLSYARTADDDLSGRNFASYTYSTNEYSNWLGSDGDKEFKTFRANAEAKYKVHRVNFARLQKLALKNGNWLVYFRADGQWADQPLVSSEQKAIGGMNSVRGFEEREVLGDNGANASLEIRSPLSTPSVSLRWNQSNRETRRSLQSFQWVAFADYGHVRRKGTRLGGELRQEDMFGIGFGFRTAIADRIQLRFDWGFPMNETEVTNTSSNGRGHVVAQLQF